MVNHGLVVAPLFFIIALLAERTGSEDIRDMGGVAFRAPVLATLFLIVALATLAMPGSANFVGRVPDPARRVQRRSSRSRSSRSTGVALASVYMLRMFIRAMHNRVGPGVKSFDLSAARRARARAARARDHRASRVYPQQALERLRAGASSRSSAGRDAVAQAGSTP